MDNQANWRVVLLWVVSYFACCMVLPVALNLLIWKQIPAPWPEWLDLVCSAGFSILFLVFLVQRYQISFCWCKTARIQNWLLAIATSVLFFAVLDCGLDPMLDRLFPASAERYYAAMAQLKAAPIVSGLQVCLAAPLIEETFMRGIILPSLQSKYGTVWAVVGTAVIFAALHFNFVQTLSALVCGLALGLLYVKTNCLACCVVTHAIYNFIGFFRLL